MKMRKALGRGIEALFPGTGPQPVSPGAGERWIAVGEIRPNRYQPRRRFDDATIGELADSIRQKGVVQPLLVRQSDGGYELIAGERRLRAAQLAGLERVPVIVREATAAESFELALVENIQREDLSPLEEAEAYRRLLDEFELTQEMVAERVGKSRSAVANLLRLLTLPESVKEQIAAGVLSAGHARALLALPSAAQRLALAREIVSAGLSVRDAEGRVAARTPTSKGRSKASAPVNLHLRAVQDDLCRTLGTRVRIVPRGRGGSIEIEYYSAEELERLLTRLAGSDLRESNVL
jgi:ParB family chromosome partitioning protein